MPPSRSAETQDRWRPWLLAGLTALLVARPMFPSEGVANEGDGLPVVMLWLALAVGWALGAIGHARVRVRFGWLDGLVVALVGWQVAASLWAAALGSPRPATNMLWEHVGLGLAYLMARQLLVGRRESRAMLAVMIALALAISSYGLYQFFYELPATRARYQANPDRELEQAGAWSPPGSPERQAFENRLASTEPMATFALANSLAGFLVPWLLIAVGVSVLGGPGAWRSRAAPWLALGGGALVIGLCLLLTKSRSAYLAALAGLALVGFYRGNVWRRLRWRRIGAASAVLIFAVVIGVLWGGLDREVLTEASKSLGYRMEYWRSTLALVADRPVFGAGPGNFQYVYTRYKLPQASEEVAEPHNFIMEVWGTAGTPALLVLLGLLTVSGWRFGRAASREEAAPACGEGLTGDWDTPLSPAENGGPPATADRPMMVAGGAILGLVLSYPLAAMSAGPPGNAAWLIGGPVLLAGLALLWPWVQTGCLPVKLPLLGAAVLLVNLLASGGFGFPGVASTFWLLLALAVNLAEPQPPHGMARPVVGVLLAAMLALTLACYQTAYRPVLEARAALAQAERKPREAVHLLEAAGRADPLWAEPTRRLAALYHRKWQETPEPQWFERFEQANAATLQRQPNVATAWQASGDYYFEALLRDHNPAHGARAVRDYRRAVALYPASATLRAKLALAHRAAAQWTSFRREAREALRLDGLTPHSDKKLPDELRQRLRDYLRASE